MKTVWASGLIAVAAGCIAFEHVPTAEPARALLTVSNGPREATWTRNFNPFLPNALFPAAGGMAEPLLIVNRPKGADVPWLATPDRCRAENTKLTFSIRSVG